MFKRLNIHVTFFPKIIQTLNYCKFKFKIQIIYAQFLDKLVGNVGAYYCSELCKCRQVCVLRLSYQLAMTGKSRLAC